MENLITKTTGLALYLIRPYIAKALAGDSAGAMDKQMAGLVNESHAAAGPLVVDATCGNGHDTLALAEMMFVCGESFDNDSVCSGRLVAVDIQPQAVNATKALLEESGFGDKIRSGNIQMVCGSHENLAAILCESGIASGSDDCAHAKASAVLFNLGYLPGGDKALTTKTDVTLRAVQSALDILAPGGVVSIIMYSGHAAGAEEKAALLDFAAGLDAKTFHTAYVSMPNQHNAPPEILLITRK